MLGRTAFSLKTKITVLVVFLIVAILLSIGFLQIERDRNLRKEERERRAITVAKTILSFNILAERRSNYSEVQRYLRRFLSQEDLAQDIVFISLHDQKGEILAGAVNRSLVGSYKVVNRVNGRDVVEERPIETAEEELEFIDKLYRRRITESSNSLRIVEINLERGSSAEDLRLIRLGFSTRGLQAEIFQAIIINLSIFAVYIVIGVIASVFLGSAISRPIKVLEEAMKRVSAGDLNQHVDIPTRDEIGTLARTFNYMTEGLREKEKLKKEFLIAREVQFNLLPRQVPEHSRLEVATYFEPATEVGGDFYDYLPIAEDQLGVIIGDVSGHGMSAGLLMAITKSCIHTQLNYEGRIDQMMASMNEILLNLSEPRSLVTLFYSVIDFNELTINYADAGHPFTYLIRGENPEIVSLESISYPLGVKKGLTFKSQSVKLLPGDFLVFYSDGIVEALDEEGSVFGYDRLEELLSSRKYESSEEMLDALITEVRIHIGSAEQFDDMTAVIIRVKE